MTIYVGIDNGTSGSIAILTDMADLTISYRKMSFFYQIPTKTEQSYTKAKQSITRIDFDELRSILTSVYDTKVLIERPMVNPTRFKATA